MLKEFRDFAARGNVLDLAVGVIIGAAFGKIVASLVNDILMPPIGLLLGGVNFREFFVALDGVHYGSLAEAIAAKAPTINYGIFLNTIIEFLIVAFAIFLLVKQINRLKKPEPVAAPDVRACPYCTSQISLKARRCPYCTSEVTPAAM